MRWRLKLEEYDYKIIHKAGKDNINTDALSQNPIQNAYTTRLVKREERQQQGRQGDYHKGIYEERETTNTM